VARILVVDDEPMIAMITEEWLVDLGHSVVGPAADLASALKLAGSGVDAAIVDVSLGREKSYPLAEALRARGVPFVFATGYGADGLEPEWRRNETLAKPFDFAALRDAVGRMIGPG
jgi:CheY-like chemotaxis protein